MDPPMECHFAGLNYDYDDLVMINTIVFERWTMNYNKTRKITFTPIAKES